MDADTRHQLKQNELAEALSRLRDLNSPGTRYTLLGIAIVVILFLAWKGWSYTRQRAVEDASARLGRIQGDLASGAPDRLTGAKAELRDLVNDASNPGLRSAARILLARAAVDLAIKDPNAREANFREARDTFQQVANDAAAPPMLQAEALFALATAEESLRNFDAARAAYEKLLKDKNGRFAGSPYALLAEQRLETLSDLNTPIAFVPGMQPGAAGPINPVAVPVTDPAELQMLQQGARIIELPAPTGEAPPPPPPTTPDAPPATPGAEPQPAQVTPSEPQPAPEPPAPVEPQPAPETPPPAEPQPAPAPATPDPAP